MNFQTGILAKKLWAYLVLLLVCISWSSVAFASPITSEMRQQDTRLEKPITVIAHRLYVGELLEYLSQQSGVTLSASEKDGTANERLSVAFQNLPLADALNAVQSLYSYQGSSYRWSRDQDSDPKKPSFSYRLVRSPDARTFAKTVTNEIQEDFAREIRGRIAALGMSPEERRKVAADPGLDMSKRSEAAMGALASILSPEQLAHTIESDEEIRIPANQLSAEGNSFVTSEKDIFTHDNPHIELASARRSHFPT